MGHSSVFQYETVLKEGCRCLELDVWDYPGKAQPYPIITHGHAMCTSVSFEEVLQAIRTHAFEASTYPLILSLEVHCTSSYQQTMAELLNRVLGKLLVLPSDSAFASTRSLPSPLSLQCRILIKGSLADDAIKGKIFAKELRDLCFLSTVPLTRLDERDVHEMASCPASHVKQAKYSDMLNKTQHHLVRVYPDGFQVPPLQLHKPH